MKNLKSMSIEELYAEQTKINIRVKAVEDRIYNPPAFSTQNKTVDYAICADLKSYLYEINCQIVMKIHEPFLPNTPVGDKPE